MPEHPLGVPEHPLGVRGRPFGSAWPPAVALVAALSVFVGVLGTTPPGLVSLADLLLRPAHDARVMGSSYAAGAAAFLALVTLGVLAPALVALDLGLRWLHERRTSGPHRPTSRRGRP